MCAETWGSSNAMILVAQKLIGNKNLWISQTKCISVRHLNKLYLYSEANEGDVIS